jgi:predicted house-cleaning noncanonical NTP pyrophosphatase (MazG superfamily)
MEGTGQDGTAKKSDLIKAMENNMTEGVTEHCQDSELSETMMSLLIYSTIGQYAKSYKKNAYKMGHKFGFKKEEIEEMVDEASRRVLDKFLEM